ncbi:MAG: sigma-70 family RNA polymerase sigma factor [Acidobacteriota bacterium]
MMSLPAADANPLIRSKALDSRAFEHLIDQHEDQLVNYLTRLTGCRDRAEDLAQETFIRFYRKFHQYREEGTLVAYLFRIATNLVRSEERRKHRWRRLQPVFSTTRLGSSEPQPSDSPQSAALASEEYRQVTRALASLDLIYRAPLVLREIEGLSYQEIARALDCSEGTIKSRIHRGRQLLKQKLTPYWSGGQHS